MSQALPTAFAARSPQPRDVARTFYIHGTLLLALAAYVLLAGPLLLLAAATVDRRRRTARRLARAIFPPLVKHYCRLAGAPLAPQGVRPIWREVGPCIVVANHASSLDVLLLMMLPAGVGDGRVWAKGWPFRKPLLGALMRLSGHLLVEDFNLLPDARDCLADGESLLVFPEASRSRTGRLGRFRDGAFLLAARTGRPIVPVALHGSYACFPPGQPWVYRPVLRLDVLGLLHADGPTPGAHLRLKRRAREMIATALADAHDLDAVCG
jgi:1-acyl-sn-glycerol-3-phosphate acyltransferase